MNSGTARTALLAMMSLLAAAGCGSSGSSGKSVTGTGGAMGGAGMGATGTGGMGTGGMGMAGSAAPAATFTQIYDMMYPMPTNARCTACHSQPPNDVGNGNLQMGMDKASVYAALIGKTSMSSRCTGKTIVIPNDPDNSLLYQKLSATPPCGSRMPLGGNPFTADQLEMIHGWIAAGAKND